MYAFTQSVVNKADWKHLYFVLLGNRFPKNIVTVLLFFLEQRKPFSLLQY